VGANNSLGLSHCKAGVLLDRCSGGALHMFEVYSAGVDIFFEKCMGGYMK
jgi:hypothetical protein